jgi:chaperonin GroES
MSNLRPLGDRVVIQPVERESMTASGIVLPDTAKEKPQEGSVVAVGPGKLLETGERVPLEIKAGDRVLYSKYSGTEFTLDGNEYLVLSERDVLAIVG